jgi:hypothetical protein
MVDTMTERDAVPTPASMATRVLRDARRTFGDDVSPSDLERYATAAVADLWRDSIKVTTFIPVLALRQIREMLENRSSSEPAGTSVR